MPRPIHFDLGAIDPARAIAFYKAAFGWTVEKWNGPTGTSNSASCQASRELRSGGRHLSYSIVHGTAVIPCPMPSPRDAIGISA